MTGGAASATDTIAAPASGEGSSARALIRISGARAREVLEDLFESDPESLALSSVTWGATQGRFRIFDRQLALPALVFFMSAPRSYSGEDLAELHIPGSPALIAEIMRALAAEGVRPAEPGEFTRRAFMMGKIDLAQVEGVAALVAAESEEERRGAMALLRSGVGADVDALVEGLAALLVPIELGLDFSDQDIEIVDPEKLEESLLVLGAQLRQLDEREEEDAARLGDRRVALVGPPNAGKSSLFNALLGKDRALVSGRAGTTRDWVESHISIGGAPALLVDTAGRGHDEHGVDEKAHRIRDEELARVDLIVEVRDGQSPTEFQGDFVVLTHADCVPLADRSSTGFWVSSETGEGVSELLREIEKRLFSSERGAAGALRAYRRRRREVVVAATEAIERATMAAEDALGLELVAADLSEALDALRSLGGSVRHDEIVDRIMRSFCIGK